MKRRWLLAFTALAVIGLLAVGTGCGGIGGEKLVVIRGKVVENGQPVKAGGVYEEGGMRIEVTFYPVDAAGNVDQARQSWSCSVQSDGTFVMDGAGKGIPAGRYKVGLRAQPGSSGQYDPRAQKATGGDLFERSLYVTKDAFCL